MKLDNFQIDFTEWVKKALMIFLAAFFTILQMCKLDYFCLVFHVKESHLSLTIIYSQENDLLLIHQFGFV